MDSKRYFNVTCEHMSSKKDADKYRLNNELFTVKYHECGNKGNGGWHTSHEIFGASHADYHKPEHAVIDLVRRSGCTMVKIVEKD
jgi:hypothetical protein